MNTWTCTICTYSSNKADFLICDMCTSLKQSTFHQVNERQSYDSNPSKRSKTSIKEFLNTSTTNKSDNNFHWISNNTIKWNDNNDINNNEKTKKRENNNNYKMDEDNKKWRQNIDRLREQQSKRIASVHKRFDSYDEFDDTSGGGQSVYHNTKNEIDGTEIAIDVASLDEGFIQQACAIESKPKIAIDKKALIADFGNSNSSINTEVAEVEKKIKYNYTMSSADTFFEETGVADEMSNVAVDTLLSKLLSISLPLLLHGNDEPLCDLSSNVPLVFKTESEYISSFEPLLIEETRAGIMSYIQTGIGNNERELYKGVYQIKQTEQSIQIYLMKIGLVSSRRSYSNVVLDEVKISKVEVENDKENQYSSYNSGNNELQKDDLVIILKKKLSNTLNSIRDAIGIPHHLAVVSEINQKENHMRLVMIKGTSPVPGTIRSCIRLTSLTTYLREWTALHSIKNTTLCPLTPYLLKCSPTISTSSLGQINNNLLSKYKALISITESSSAAVRKNNLIVAIENEIRLLQPIKTDYSTLKKTDIVNTIKAIIALEEIPQHCKELAKSILKVWKESMKLDMKESRIKKLKGGKLMEIPTNVLDIPHNICPVLWNYFSSHFNKSQLFAIKYIIDDSNTNQDTKISLIQGPPGTGKTSTIIGLIAALLATSCKRVLVCGPSNAAVDEICRRLILPGGLRRTGGHVKKCSLIRIGLPLTKDPDIEKLSLEYQTEKLVEQSGGFYRLQTSNKAINELQIKMQAILSQKAGLSAEGVYRELQKEMSIQRQNKKNAEIEIEWDRSMFRQQLLKEAEVVCATFSGSGSKIMIEYIKNGTIPCYDTVILDEAAQATEPSSLIPLRYGCRKLVLVGDPRQLPATCLSKDANDAGLGRSLFERLERADHEKVMLGIQYRMHPDICLFPSNYFYDGKLITCDKIYRDVDDAKLGIINASSICARFLRESKLKTVNFLDLQSLEEKVGQSYRNTAEISYILALLADMIRAIQTSLVQTLSSLVTIALITPYKAQVNKMRDELTKMIKSNPLTRQLLQTVEINTVDGFQGREVDIVIFSCVRTNDQGFVGFVNDDRRLNVGLTRAKKCLIIVGNALVMQHERNVSWSALLQSLKQRQCLQKVELPYKSLL